ncbi:SDR family oxidoreductase [Chitinophaga sedimenti]|uniref:SDR family oxidoreductase n=1 Tax=Chitinophaga sedimenti TaxID=2033606 RepID=UPI002006086F|nr:SDR family oxidoreductase [Chitinophaga sedimenti]MCK7555718.1 SDR family oxidoreductase [Chitinophaga sedimenti]
MELSGKTAVVTGGTSGIGYATALELKARGAQVIITGRTPANLEKAAAELGVHGILADQSKLKDTDNLVAEVGQRHGKVDILFVNAGVAGMGPIAEVTEQFFDEMMNINFKGAYFTLSKFIPLLADGASVVFLSSNTATMNGAQSSVYSASKAALNKVMKIAAQELAPRNIRVNAVSPGPTATPIMKKTGLDDAQMTQLYDALIERIPLHRIAPPQEIASLVAYLCSDAAGFITGAEFLADGGLSL